MSTSNEVRLVGRVSGEPEERELPSGDRLRAFTVVVDRDRPRTTPSGRTVRSDALECVAWSAGVQRTVAGWQPGDVVEVTGALRRRFWRGGGSRYEVEVLRAKRLTRAA